MRPEFKEESLRKWGDALNRIFDGVIPTTSRWNDKESMIRVLSVLGDNKNQNHTFFPQPGGGLDLKTARLSNEPDCIELDFERNAAIVKPSQLMFESFGKENLEWAYFRLELLLLNPTGIYPNNSPHAHEELIEIEPGKYQDRSTWDSGVMKEDEMGNAILFPKSARIVTRYFSGAFVVFAKGSTYNANPGTYDARHDKMSAQEFRRHIEEAYRTARG